MAARQTNPFTALKAGIVQQTMRAMSDAGDAICDGMRERLSSAGHVDTGELLDSIRQETVQEGEQVVTYIYADAKSQDGVQYAEFIELGTGAEHGRSGGREGTWRYKDRNGNWHTTNGMDADPFIAPSVEENLPRLEEFLTEYMFNIAKYSGKGDAP